MQLGISSSLIRTFQKIKPKWCDSEETLILMMYLDISNTDTVYMSRKIQQTDTKAHTLWRKSGCSCEYCSNFFFLYPNVSLPPFCILVTRSAPIWCPKLGIRTGKSGRRVLRRLQQSYQRPSSSQPTLESCLCP